MQVEHGRRTGTSNMHVEHARRVVMRCESFFAKRKKISARRHRVMAVTLGGVMAVTLDAVMAVTLDAVMVVSRLGGNWSR